MENLLIFLFAIIIGVLISLCGAGILMWAWNAVLPVLLHWPVITFWQSFAICLLLTFVGNTLSGARKQ